MKIPDVENHATLQNKGIFRIQFPRFVVAFPFDSVLNSKILQFVGKKGHFMAKVSISRVEAVCAVCAPLV